MTKNQLIAEHVAVTFFEGAGAYLIAIPTVSWGKSALAGAVAAGLSLVYNVLRQSQPTLVDTTPPVTGITLGPGTLLPPPPETPAVPPVAPPAV